MVTRVSPEMVQGLAGELAGKQNDLGLDGKATGEDYRSGEPNKALEPAGVWGAAGFVDLSDAATITPDFSAGFNFTVTLGGNRTLGNPSNVKIGQCGIIEVWQDAAGSRTLAFGSEWRFANGEAPELSTGANARDLLSYLVLPGGDVFVSLIRDVR